MNQQTLQNDANPFEPTESETRNADADPVDVTLLELVKAVTEVSENEQEVIATVAHMLQSGSVKLRGCFRDEPIAAMAV